MVTLVTHGAYVISAAYIHTNMHIHTIILPDAKHVFEYAALVKLSQATFLRQFNVTTRDKEGRVITGRVQQLSLQWKSSLGKLIDGLFFFQFFPQIFDHETFQYVFFLHGVLRARGAGSSLAFLAHLGTSLLDERLVAHELGIAGHTGGWIALVVLILAHLGAVRAHSTGGTVTGTLGCLFSTFLTRRLANTGC